MGLNEAINVILNILKQVMEDKLSPTNIEIVTVTPDKLYHMLDKEEIQEVCIVEHFKWYLLYFH